MQNLDLDARVELKATDPMTLIDVPNFCREAGHKVEQVIEEADFILYIIRKC